MIPELAALLASHRQQVAPAWRRFGLGLGAAAVLGGAHAARLGTPGARAAVGALVLGVLALLVLVALLGRRTARRPERAVRQVLGGEARERLVRAVRLLGELPADGSRGSPELGRLHLARLVAQAAGGAAPEHAARRARLWHRLGLLGAAVALGAVIAGPLRVVEGLDVLLARAGVAPLPLVWLGGAHATAQPPRYLRHAERGVLHGLPTALPRGTVVALRGTPRVGGRKLVLFDPETRDEVPFVSDGAEGVVARWELGRSARLVVAARFGEVLIPEYDAWALTVIDDAVPEVLLDGAPAVVALDDLGDHALAWTARDDHGLTQVDLVLRTGDRVDRRVLARFDDVTQHEQGGYTLSAREPFLRRAFLPVQVTIEARDDDPSGGDRWGRSAPFTVVPAVVGRAEAERHAALVEARDAAVTLLAGYLEAGGDRARPTPALPAAARAAHQRAELALGRVTGERSSGVAQFARGQVARLVKPRAAGESLERRYADVALALDAAVSSHGTREATAVARRLADLVEEVAVAARAARTAEGGGELSRLDAALAASQIGAAELRRLGALGWDLGGVARGDLARAARAREREALGEVELAAAHLAARLRRPQPSFPSGGRGGVESGAGAGSSSGTPEEPSQADDRFDQLAGELEQLTEEHASELERVERALEEADQEDTRTALEGEAKRRAEQLRQEARDLPLHSPDPESARGAAALGREHMGAAADALERLDLEGAERALRDALSALDDATKRARQPRGPQDEVDEEALREAREALKRELEWVEQQSAALNERARERARRALGDAAGRERELARRAGNLASRGETGEAPLPGEATDGLSRAEGLMQDAAKALELGDVEKALELQREAQRLLEQASRGRLQGHEPDERAPDEAPRPRADEDGRDGAPKLGGDVPQAGADRAEAFRRRVLEGLGREKGGRLSPAVQRYAEGLLR